ncbi:Lon protease 2 [Roseovarius gaetbuli]|uniref:endopeptidase La n=1 Tax=Roseovarius gaetbuli TaxID=1356575 RepID=A0A1X6Z1K9_9RHOB|nr:ATP-binding protein [Roseovarius gaetbuli]SLN38115.1 Lon protease 2 [Roseovarius gaetbuli]
MAKKKPKADLLPTGLAPEVLRVECDPGDIGFETTANLRSVQTMIGQDRAIDAINLAARIAHKDFNIYVLGRMGMGRHETVSKLISEQAADRPAPSDWVYVNNFDAPHKPNAMQLPAGSASRLKSAMQDLVDDLANEIPALFESEEYQTQRRAIEEEFGQRHEEPIAEFAERAAKDGVALLRTPMGFMLAAIIDGKPIKPEVYEALAPEEREEIDAKVERLQDQLADVLRHGPQLEKEYRQRIEELHAGLAERVVSLRVKEVADQFRKIAEVGTYLEHVRKDMISNAELFLISKEEENNGPFPEVIRKFHLEPQFDRYAVNIMVSHDVSKDVAAPVVSEDLPTLHHLTGRIEHISEMGTLVTNFTLIKPGALHRANGGFLVLDAVRLLSEPYAWEALKRSLQSQSISITSLSDRLGLVSTISLEPDPIPLNLRVVLIGDRRLHMLLCLLDPEFNELFKLQADFEDDLPRTAKNTRLMARVVAGYAQQENLRPMSAAAVAALLDQAVRLADDSTKFTLQLGALKDVMREADHYAGQAGKEQITDADIAQAINQADRRASRIQERLQEAVARKTILIDTAGSVVGQVNGLSVVGTGQHYFGRPSRITARVRMGAGKVIDIEREVELGGPLHSKGVLILGGFLASRYARDVPMSLHASLVFEQSYGGVDGDSASSAELYALLSALSGVPIRQGFAVTGSVNQNGEVQAIGGVNEKIEGFFDTCKARRLTGDQGVLIPAANVEHLMLRRDVVEAARAGKFRVIAIKTIDEGIEALTGRVAGKRKRSGAFPEGSINALVEAQLKTFAETRRRFVKDVAAPPKPEDRT